MAGQFFGSDPNIQREIIDGCGVCIPTFSGNLLIQLGRIDENSMSSAGRHYQSDLVFRHDSSCNRNGL